MSLSPFLPCERKSFPPVAVISRANVGCLNDLFNNSHAILKKKIALRQRESLSRITLQQPAVGAHFVRFRVDLDVGCDVIQLEIRLAEVAASAHRDGGAAERFEIVALQTGGRNKMKR